MIDASRILKTDSQNGKVKEVRIKEELVYCTLYWYTVFIDIHNSVSRSMDLCFEIEARNQSVPFNRASLSFDSTSFNIDNFIPLLASSSLSFSLFFQRTKRFRRKFATNLYKGETVVISLTKKFNKHTEISHTVIEGKNFDKYWFRFAERIERRIFIKRHCVVIIMKEKFQWRVRFKYRVIVIDKKISININFEVSTYFPLL